MLALIVSIACLLHSASAVQHLGANNCTCMGWREAYLYGRAKCGQGAELLVNGGPPTMGDWTNSHFYCDNFYRKLRGNSCVKKLFGEENSQTWCYTSRSCRGPEAPYADKIAGDIKQHDCTPDQDSISTKTFPQLVAFAKEHDLELLFAALLAYRQYQGWDGLSWNNVADFMINGTTPTLVSGINTQELQGIVDSGVPVLFRSSNDHPEHVLVEGGNIYSILVSKYLRESFEGPKGQLRHYLPYDFQMSNKDLTCLKGDCSEAISCFEGRTCANHAKR